MALKVEGGRGGAARAYFLGAERVCGLVYAVRRILDGCDVSFSNHAPGYP